MWRFRGPRRVVRVRRARGLPEPPTVFLSPYHRGLSRSGWRTRRWSSTRCSPASTTGGGSTSPARRATTSSAEDLTHDPPDVIRCLEDTDGDGRFDKSTVFADRLTFPQGVLWHDGAIYTASPPSLWRLEDTDGDGVADRRKELVTGFPFTGHRRRPARPLPGARRPALLGRRAVRLRDPQAGRRRSSARGKTPLIMRCRPDGDDVEVFSAGDGQPGRGGLQPRGRAVRLRHVPEPRVAGGRACATRSSTASTAGSIRSATGTSHEEKRTGDLLPPLAQLGVARRLGRDASRAAASFGDDDRLDALLGAVQPAQRRAPRPRARRGHLPRRRGAVPRVGRPDFHPTDVLEDADGSLLVVDTGGWFRSCPTSQIDKPNVRGAIYRIRRGAAARSADPDAA